MRRDITKFYHGTTTSLNIKNFIEPASVTNIKREEFRNKLSDKVFITNSIVSAEKYAKLSSQKYGGEPIVYTVIPDKYSLIYLHNGEYICDYARIIK